MTLPLIGRNYPAPGTDIFDAWSLLWDRLGDENWVSSVELTEDLICVQPRTGVGLLQKARKKGLLEVKYELRNSRRVAHYRRAPLA